MANKRRRLGWIIANPLTEFYETRAYDSLVFIEHDNQTALKTRAATLMYINRHYMRLTTMVRDNEIWIFKRKDIFGHSMTVDLR